MFSTRWRKEKPRRSSCNLWCCHPVYTYAQHGCLRRCTLFPYARRTPTYKIGCSSHIQPCSFGRCISKAHMFMSADTRAHCKKRFFRVEELWLPLSKALEWDDSIAFNRRSFTFIFTAVLLECEYAVMWFQQTASKRSPSYCIQWTTSSKWSIEKERSSRNR